MFMFCVHFSHKQLNIHINDKIISNNYEQYKTNKSTFYLYG